MDLTTKRPQLHAAREALAIVNDALSISRASDTDLKLLSQRQETKMSDDDPKRAAEARSGNMGMLMQSLREACSVCNVECLGNDVDDMWMDTILRCKPTASLRAKLERLREPLGEVMKVLGETEHDDGSSTYSDYSDSDTRSTSSRSSSSSSSTGREDDGDSGTEDTEGTDGDTSSTETP